MAVEPGETEAAGASRPCEGGGGRKPYPGIAGASAYAPVGLLGLLLLFQTTRVRFVFDNEALEVKVGDQLQESGENVFVGGKNRWKYSTFVNWELWWPQFPILVYFKETQTKPEGQIHFFTVIFAAANYCLTCSDHSSEGGYNPTRECFIVDIQEVGDDHAADAEEGDKADPEVAQPPVPPENPP
nr:unnamed protein product [Digitaria exilis]